MILVLGQTGYIGTQFINELNNRNLSYEGISRVNINYCNFSDLYSYLTTGSCLGPARYDLIINCAGYVGKPNVDACEDHKAETIEGNVVLPKTISNVCREAGVKFMHISSGCIYDGYDKEFTEEDPPNFSFKQNNCSFYSGSKALAEDLIDKDNSYICRLRIPFDEFDNSRNYISKLKNYDKLLNVKNSISHRGDFVKACLDLYLNNCPTGIYNIVNSGHVTTEQVARLMSKYNIRNDFNFFSNEKTFYEFGAKAPRSNCLLDNSKLSLVGVQIRDVNEALEEALFNWVYKEGNSPIE
ncbi:MAG: dTDP-4-dehydrorhamnose reductase [Parcubacteria group bacterium]|nr:dTDP-4-dehydrorhamnose reductase [Parcubacteria group bacterium]|tara:strand:- start:34797 stop:35690 length:894 start_codon:yes stop_codon:yes gene_type:complete